MKQTIEWLKRNIWGPVLVAVILGALTLGWARIQLPAQNRDTLKTIKRQVDSIKVERDTLATKVNRIETLQKKQGEKLSNVDGKLDVIIQLLKNGNGR
nr:hypothetical protein 14 [bacterium]